MRRSSLVAIAMIFASSPTLAQSSSGQQATAAAGVDEFARAAAESNLSEVMLATMALQKTNDKRVQDDAWMMLEHHGRAMGNLAEALSDGAASLPTEASEQQKSELRRMEALNGTQFDQAYFNYQVGAHQRAISLYEQGARLPDQKVAQYARTTLPVLRAHREITQIRQAQPPQPMPGQ